MLERHEMPHLPHKTALQPVLKPSTRRGLAASPIDTARLPYISHFAASKSTFSYEFSYGPTAKSTFRARLPPFTKCYPCHGICTLPPLRAALTIRFAENTQHDTSKVLHLGIGGLQSVTPATKNATRRLKTSQSSAPATQNEY